jgi:hypothetical protein
VQAVAAAAADLHLLKFKGRVARPFSFNPRFTYLRRNKDKIRPKNPKIAKPEITKPIGRPAVPVEIFSTGNVGITNCGGGVKVGIRVAGKSTTNWDAKVGSIVGVTLGVGVGGASTIGSSP